MLTKEHRYYFRRINGKSIWCPERSISFGELMRNFVTQYQQDQTHDIRTALANIRRVRIFKKIDYKKLINGRRY